LQVELTAATVISAACVEVLFPSGVQVRVPCEAMAAINTVLAAVAQLDEPRSC
jgi:hypothetical protein